MATTTNIKAGDKVEYIYDAGKSGRAWEGIVLAIADGHVMVSWDAVKGKPRPHVQANPLKNVKLAASAPAKKAEAKAPAKKADVKAEAKSEAPTAEVES